MHRVPRVLYSGPTLRVEASLLATIAFVFDGERGRD